MGPQALARGLGARLGLRPVPLSLTYELTWLCNLACAYCDRHTPMAAELSLEQSLQALSELRELGLAHVNLDGGDPLTRPHCGALVDWLVERGLSVTMHTNGVLVPQRLETVRKLDKVKISVDGPRDTHDEIRGAGSFEKAAAGARAALSAGVRVEFTCTVGRHNVDVLEPLVAFGESLRVPVVFQPALNSLFLATARDGTRWQLEAARARAAFAFLERLKGQGRGVGNGWSSLRHFRSFPDEKRPPCAAGWVMATMDPEGALFPCGQVNRSDRSNNVLKLGAKSAFAGLSREGCAQCWCARLVEGNYAWGLRVDQMLPPAVAAS